MTKIENKKLDNILEKYSLDILVLLFLILIAGVGLLIIKNSGQEKSEIVFEKGSEGVKGADSGADSGPSSVKTSERAGNPGMTEDERVNLNTANREELIALPQIGEKTADKIVGYREQIGLFKDTSEITKIQGISEKTYLKIKDLIKVDSP